MSSVAPRALLIACLVLGAANTASADPAPITYAANQDAPGTLAGGDARSYGYGSSATSGPVIDLRRGAHAQSAQQTSQIESAATEQARPAWLEQERVGPPYQANGRWYVPAAEPGYEATGTASWYGPTFNGQRTASGEVFDQEAITAAHPTLPLPSLVQVTNLENGREVIVRVNDRGPFVGDRVIDLSHGAAQVLGVERNGTARVHIRYLGPAPRHYDDAASPPPQAPVQTASVQRQEQGPASLLPPASAEPEQGTAPAVQAVAYEPAAPMPLGRFFVQVGAFSDVNNAHRVQAAVASAGSVAVDVRRNAAGVELFRVRVGPYASREEAEAAQRAVAALGYAEAVVAAP